MTDPGHPQPAAPSVPELQFDHVESTVDTADGAAASTAEGIRCSACGSMMRDEYYSIGGKSICAACRASVETARATSRTPKAFAKAFGFGLGAALAGAAVYYAVIALLDLEIGIVAILIGWMVGRAIQKALPGGGLRRYQVLAAVLTYFAVGAAYLPLVMGDMRTSGIGALIFLAFSLPVMAIFSGGSGIISALIIGIGIRQAWRMSGAPALAVTGPFRLGHNTIVAGGA